MTFSIVPSAWRLQVDGRSACVRPILLHSALAFAIASLAQPMIGGLASIAIGLVLSALIVLLGRVWVPHPERRTTSASAPITNSASAGSSIAHDLRTRLAIITLQLNRIDDPRARVLEQDIKELSDTIDELAVMLPTKTSPRRDRV